MKASLSPLPLSGEGGGVEFLRFLRNLWRIKSRAVRLMRRVYTGRIMAHPGWAELEAEESWRTQMGGNKWFKIRLVLFVLSFASALFVPNPQIEELSRASGMDRIILSVALVLVAVFIPFALLCILTIQTINPFSDRLWSRPNHQSNPFRLGNPLLFFHFAAYFFAAAGAGTIISCLWRGLFAVIFGLTMLGYSLSLLIGVRLVMGVFKHKMEKESSSSRRNNNNEGIFLNSRGAKRY